MPYHPKLNGVNPTPISGSYLAHNHASTVIRAFIGADLVSGGRKHITAILPIRRRRWRDFV